MSRLETRLSDESGSLRHSCCIAKAVREAKTTILCLAFYIYTQFCTKEALNTSNRHQTHLMIFSYHYESKALKGHPDLDVFWFIRLLLPIIEVILQSVFRTQGLPSTWGSPTSKCIAKKLRTIQSKVEQSLRDLLLKPMFISINGWMEKTSNKHEHR